MVKSGLRNSGGVVFSFYPVADLEQFIVAGMSAQEFVDIDQARSGEDTLVADSSVTGFEKLQELNLQIASGGKIRVAAFAGENVVLFSILVQTCLAQARARRDNRLVARGLAAADPVQRNQVVGLQRPNAPGIGFQVIDE